MSSRQCAFSRLLLPAALGLAIAAAGCETLDAINPFTEKEKKLTGTRVPVFPDGVPGVDYNAPPPQPATVGGYDSGGAPEQSTSAAMPLAGSSGKPNVP